MTEEEIQRLSLFCECLQLKHVEKTQFTVLQEEYQEPPFFLLFHAGFHLVKPWFSGNPFLAMWSKVDP